MIASDVMTVNPATVSSNATLAEASELMRELDVRHLPVVEGGALVAMLSDRDLACVDLAQRLGEEGVKTLKAYLATPVMQVMSTDVISAEPDTELSDVVGLMLEHKVGAVPVVRTGTRRLVGIISYIDVLRATQDLLEES